MSTRQKQGGLARYTIEVYGDGISALRRRADVREQQQHRVGARHAGHTEQ